MDAVTSQLLGTRILSSAAELTIVCKPSGLLLDAFGSLDVDGWLHIGIADGMSI